MKTLRKIIVAGGTGLLALGISAAMAADHRPERSDRNSDHSSRAANNEDRDRNRPGANRDSSFSLSISFGNDRYDRYGSNDRGRRNGYRGRNGRIVKRKVFQTRYRARIVLTEEAVRTRRGPSLVCTVSVNGPQAHHVPRRRLQNIAARNCSRRARVRIYT